MQLRSFMILYATAFLAASALMAQDNDIRVGRNVQVSQARASLAHGEPFVATDPADSSRLIAASMAFEQDANSVLTIVYSSFDGGRTWVPTLDTSQFSQTDDPGIAYSPSGEPIVVMGASVGNNGQSRTLIYRSPDHGRTWAPPVMLPESVATMHRQFVTANRRNVYVTGTGRMNAEGKGAGPEQLLLFSSADGGAHFSGPAKTAPPEHRITGHVTTAVLSDGTIVCLLTELRPDDATSGPGPTAPRPTGWLKAARSTDGGRSFLPFVLVDDSYLDLHDLRINNAPALAVDPGSDAFKDRLYAVWPDQRSGRAEILLSYSSDKGTTWSKPRPVNDDRAFGPGTPGPDDFMPAVAVNKSGVVGVLWNDRRDNPDGVAWWTRFAASLDGGQTFLPSVRVSEAPAAFGRDEKWTVNAQPRSTGSSIAVNVNVHAFHFLGGDYGWMAADADGAFHPFWVDNRTGVPQVWTAAVQVNAIAFRNGAPELSALEDISPRVGMEVTKTSYDRATSVLTLDVRLRNTSSEVLQGPFKLRVVNLRPKIGDLTIVPGMVWTFITERLKPGEVTASQDLTFRFTNVRALQQGHAIDLGMLSFEAVVLAKPAR